jgi:5-methyltetrahydropteroyltriglutamate--homocysteine methyltransferase
LESRRELTQRVEDASQYVPLDHLCLSPQCGFSSTVHGNEITHDDQWNKLNLVIDTAREVWGEV